MLERNLIPVHGDGAARRDYTYVADSRIHAAVAFNKGRHEIINPGDKNFATLMDFIYILAAILCTRAITNHRPEQPVDVSHTLRDIRKAQVLLGYYHCAAFRERVARWCLWLREGATSCSD